ncbi:MAG TPA: MarC family protein [Alphaproteobacteria bacterium]|nr:MarC family protein [Alphaproteobacteria bacterium]
MLDTFITAFIAFFVTIEPIGVGPVFAGLTRGYDPKLRRSMAYRGTLIGTAILLVFALAGRYLLNALGIGFPAFRIAGGILLLMLSIDMVLARPSGLRSTTPGEDEEASQKQDISVFPLGIPLIAGPGALTSIVLLMGRAEGHWVDQLLVLAALGIVMLMTLAVLLGAGAVSRLLGVTGTNVISRVLGILLSALAVQFILTGIEQASTVRLI